MKRIFIISSLILGLSFTASAEDLEKVGANKIQPPVWVCLSYNYQNGAFYTAKGNRRQNVARRALRKCRRQFYGSNFDDFFIPGGRRRICSRVKCLRWGGFQGVPLY
jgi:hypothetical protein